MIEAGDIVAGRAALSGLLLDPNEPLDREDAKTLRAILTRLNQRIFHGDQPVANDPLIDTVEVKTGDRLVTIGRRYRIPYGLIERINKVDARRIRVGQSLRVPRGPFHAVVDKSDFRLDLYLIDDTGQWVYIKSFSVGLGEEDSTPVGQWRIRPGSKVVNPGWTNPRTGETFQRDDPKNPIGEYWLGLEGTDPSTQLALAYGIHGTIDADSVGQQMSMGCVRLNAPDIAELFDTLIEGESTVEIRP